MAQTAQQRNKDISDKYREVLFPAGYFVGIKMLQSLEGLEKVKRPPKPRMLCQLISQAFYVGRTVMVTPDDMACYMGSHLMGFGDVPADAPGRYAGWQFANDEAALKTFDCMTKFDRGTYKAMLIGPMERFPVDPDVMLFFGNASQMLVGMSAYLRNRGGVFNASFSNNGGCGSAIVVPMKEKRPNLLIPGNAWKLLAMPADDLMVFAIPFELISEMLESALKLRATGGSRYPPAWQHIDWDIQPPIADLLKKEGGGPSWLRR